MPRLPLWMRWCWWAPPLSGESEEGRTQQVFGLPVEEKHRGGISVVVWQVTMNRLHQVRRVVKVPWINKELKVRWEHMVSKLEPGAKETWTAVIEGAGGEAAPAEMVATLYDASLDAFAPHSFESLAGFLRQEYEHQRPWQFSSGLRGLGERSDFKRGAGFYLQEPFRRFIDELMIFDGGVWGDTSGEDGTVRMTLTMPEALTQWRFLGMAHDKELWSGLLEGETVTAKGLMVQPNPPRFLLGGDELWFTVKVTNTSDKEQSGSARLTLSDAATEADKTAALGIPVPDQASTVPAKESRAIKWKIVVPDGAGFLNCKAVASSGTLSDGEEG